MTSRRSAKLLLGITALLVGLGPNVQAASVKIDHEPLECIVYDSFPRVDAAIQPRELDHARVYFRATGSADWYFVPLEAGEQRGWGGSLPKPLPQLRSLDYYLEARNLKGKQALTPEYRPIVSTRTYCENEGMTVTETVDPENVALILGITRFGQDLIPEGFSTDGITHLMMPDGTIQAYSQAGMASGGGSGASSGAGAGGAGTADAGAAAEGMGTAEGTTGTMSGGGAAGGGAAGGAAGGGAAGGGAAMGGSSGTVWWIIGGVAVAGGAAYAATEALDDDDEDGTEPGTGDIAFRLTWSTVNDLDLYVREPNGTVIYYGNRNSATGGELDVDANASCQNTTTNPVENIYWPTGSAPHGTYEVWTNHWGDCGGSNPCPFTLRILLGTSTVRTYSGSVWEHDDSTHWTYTY